MLDMVSTPGSPLATVSPAGAHAAVGGGAAVVGVVGVTVVGVAPVVVVDGPIVVDDGAEPSVVVGASTLVAATLVAATAVVVTVDASVERSLEQAARSNTTARSALVRLMAA